MRWRFYPFFYKFWYLRDRISWQTAIPFLLYLIAMGLLGPREVSLRESAIFILYAIFVFWIVWNYALHETEGALAPKFSRWFFTGLLIFAALFLVGTRLMPFIRYGEAPLGYDTGFYLKAMEEAVAAEGLTAQIHLFLWTPLLWLGISPSYLLHGLYFLIQIINVGAFYMLARTFFPTSRIPYAAVLSFLFAVSMVQFSAYWWMFYQTQLSIAFLLVTLALLYRRNPLAAVTAGFGAATHTPTFFPFGAALGLYAVIRFIRSRIRKEPLEWEAKFVFVVAILMPFFIVALRGVPYIIGQIKYISHYSFLATNFPEYKIPETLGLFIDFFAFRLLEVYIYPFAVLGMLLVIFKKVPNTGLASSNRWLLLGIFTGILFILAYFPFIYQHRFLIYLDLALILFAAYPLFRLIQYFLSDRAGRVLIAVLLLGFSMFVVFVIRKQRPQVFPNELEEIKAIASIAEPGAYSMVTHPLYTPWVYAFSGRILVAPGYLANQWRLDHWEEFWAGSDDVRRHELLRLYRKPLYVFIGSWLDENRGIQFLKRDPYVVQISPHIWKYDTRGLSLETIAETLSGSSILDNANPEDLPSPSGEDARDNDGV